MSKPKTYHEYENAVQMAFAEVIENEALQAPTELPDEFKDIGFIPYKKSEATRLKNHFLPAMEGENSKIASAIGSYLQRIGNSKSGGGEQAVARVTRDEIATPLKMSRSRVSVLTEFVDETKLFPVTEIAEWSEDSNSAAVGFVKDYFDRRMTLLKTKPIPGAFDAFVSEADDQKLNQLTTDALNDETEKLQIYRLIAASAYSHAAARQELYLQFDKETVDSWRNLVR